MCNCHSILESSVMFSGVKLSIRSFNFFLSFILASRTARNLTSRNRTTFCLVAVTFFLPSKTETDEPQYH